MSILSMLPFSKKMRQAQQWSFTDENGSAALPDAAVMDVHVTAGGTVVSSKIEKGSFATYNKSTEPLEINVTLSFQGSDTFLQSIIDKVDKLKEALTYFSVVTPIHEYEKMTLQNYDYQLSADNGLGVLYINASLIEVREVDVMYSTTDVSSIPSQDAADPSDVSQQDTGMTTGQAPTQAQGEAGAAAGKKAKKSVLAGVLN